MNSRRPPSFDEIPATSAGIPTRRGALAVSLQEVLTVICRIRAGQPVGSDAGAVRETVKQWLGAAGRSGEREGYSEEFVVLAGYAVITFLDESVLNSSDPIFSEWHRGPLQEEIFGDFLGGERFFQNLDELIRRPPSEDLADVLEVYLLCMALGFQGQYGPRGAGGLADLRHFWERGRDKVVGVRGAWGDLSPSWSLPPYEEAPSGMDRFTRGLMTAAFATLVLYATLWAGFFVILRLHSLSP